MSIYLVSTHEIHVPGVILPTESNFAVNFYLPGSFRAIFKEFLYSMLPYVLAEVTFASSSDSAEGLPTQNSRTINFSQKIQFQKNYCILDCKNTFIMCILWFCIISINKIQHSFTFQVIFWCFMIWYPPQIWGGYQFQIKVNFNGE